MRAVACALADRLPGEWPAFLAEHRRGCPSCGEAARRRQDWRRSLTALGAETVPAPPGLQGRVLARLGEQDSADPRRALVARARARYTAAVGIAGAALVAFTAGVVRRHSRALG